MEFIGLKATELLQGNSLLLTTKSLWARNFNEAVKREHHQLPTFDKILTRLTASGLFSKFNYGYWQVSRDEASSISILITMNIPFVRYRFKGLRFGIHSAQEVFHKIISQSFNYIDHVETNVDGILIWGQSNESHDRSLIDSLERTKKIGVTLNMKKCRYWLEERVCVGHKPSKDANENKIRRITGWTYFRNIKFQRIRCFS